MNVDLGKAWEDLGPPKMDKKKSYPCVTLVGTEFASLPSGGDVTFSFQKTRETRGREPGDLTVELELRKLVKVRKAKAVQKEKSTEEVLDALREEVETEKPEEVTGD